MLQALSLHFTVGFERNTPSCREPLASDTHLSKGGGKKNIWHYALNQSSLTGSIVCPLICKKLEPNFWAQSTYPEQNTDKWWKWSRECCGVLLETSIISFTQRALSGVNWLCWRGQRGRRLREEERGTGEEGRGGEWMQRLSKLSDSQRSADTAEEDRGGFK